MNEISTALRGLKMPGMATCWERLLETRRTEELSIHDCLQMLIQAENDSRLQSRNARLIKKARFRYQATLEEMTFDATRGLEKSAVLNLASCDYISNGVSVLSTGPAGTGKSYLATALGMQACRLGMKVAYYNVYKLFEELALARISSTLHKFFARMAQTDLLILDDFGMKVLDGQQLLDFMELIEDRHGQRATILVSQLPVSEWYDILKGNTTAADAILDRLVHTAIRFELKGDSLRKKRKSLAK